MKKILLIMIALSALFVMSCNMKKNSENLNGVHKVVVKEIIQANAYTYLNVTENGKEQWIAVTKIEAKEGDEFYFKDFMEMKGFESKDLGRTFESVYFIQELKTEPNAFKGEQAMEMPEGHAPVGGHEGKPNMEQEKVTIEPAEGGITIAELFENKKKYEGKKVIIRGKLVKANYAIMDKNWYHIQDGTSANGKFDLTITSTEEGIEENTIVTFEGTVALNKDFGYGYKYDVLLENGKLK